jgi:hypothetical protein
LGKCRQRCHCKGGQDQGGDVHRHGNERGGLRYTARACLSRRCRLAAMDSGTRHAETDERCGRPCAEAMAGQACADRHTALCGHRGL